MTFGALAVLVACNATDCSTSTSGADPQAVGGALLAAAGDVLGQPQQRAQPQDARVVERRHVAALGEEELAHALAKVLALLGAEGVGC